MEIWYRACWGEIKSVEVAKYTDKSVWVKGGREMRVTSYFSYHPTWEEARAALLKEATQKLETARFALQRAQGELGNVQGMRCPVSAPEQHS